MERCWQWRESVPGALQEVTEGLWWRMGHRGPALLISQAHTRCLCFFPLPCPPTSSPPSPSAPSAASTHLWQGPPCSGRCQRWPGRRLPLPSCAGESSPGAGSRAGSRGRAPAAGTAPATGPAPHTPSAPARPPAPRGWLWGRDKGELRHLRGGFLTGEELIVPVPSTGEEFESCDLCAVDFLQ